MKLKSDLVVAEPFAGCPRPVDRVFAHLDVLLGCAALIVEADDPAMADPPNCGQNYPSQRFNLRGRLDMCAQLMVLRGVR